ncbi:hypothetical protein W97_08463 [Coniosporium apollinis CBS 100218]|uniref:Nudix hydrolase domain-containing protein n=1 Tax=Coniosporium apollinis (strain CBS 100218) TaxID=1168221 RepID=R7Z5B7_CONA1|nr:uncharacterized protein W97_08463 [Coniosporium apollinis CBS 100218]EON69303.1 hypothetical protein W97_08463 [Coniosporium apollinis CBS 100218]
MSKVFGTKKDVAYTERLAVRIIMKNDMTEIVIILVKNGNYYKLPGGGIEAGEDHRIAGEREAMEETGCKVMMDEACMATTEEWRNDLHQNSFDNLHQISYCYRAHLVKDTGVTQLTKDEIADGLQHKWISVKSAIEKMKTCEPTTELGGYIKERDLYFVEMYAKDL